MVKVLLVDDSIVMRKIISKSIEEAGLIVDKFIEAGDMSSAIYEVGNNSDIDLVIFEFSNECMRFEQILSLFIETKEGGVPIIISTIPDRLEEAKRKVADGYLVKPYGKDDMIEVLGKHLGIKGSV